MEQDKLQAQGSGDRVKVAGSKTVTFDGADATESAEITPEALRRYHYWKIGEFVLTFFITGWAIFTLFRTDRDNIHTSITQHRIRNIGGNAKLEHERFMIKDIPVVYWAILAGFVKLGFCILQLPTVGSTIMQHVWVNRPNAARNENNGFPQYPIDQLGLFENAIFWPFLFMAAEQLVGVTDWQTLVILGSLSVSFGLLITLLLVYRFADVDIYPFAAVAFVIVFAFVWSLIDVHYAAHETDYPVGFFVYNWIFIIGTLGLVIVVIGTHQASWNALALIIYTVIFHHACLWILTINAFVVGEKDL